MNRFSLNLLCGVSSLCIASHAAAQTVPAAASSDAPLAEVNSSSQTESTAANAGDIIVTGSRIIRNGDQSPTPVTVVTTEELQRTRPNAMLAETLMSLPAFSGSRTSSSNPSTTGAAIGGNGTANQLNLRNLGATRNLVLLDGKRVPPTLFNGVVDADIIPQALVKRVDIVTGGVSAVYGSDAVSGVVNYVLDHNFNGLGVNASSGISQRGDNARLDFGAVFGTDIGDRAHFEFSYQHFKENGIDPRTSRPWIAQAGVTGLGTSANPFVLNRNLRQSGIPFGGVITTGTLAGGEFATNGVMTPFVNGTATGSTGIQLGGNGGYYDASLVGSIRSDQFFGRLDYDFSDDIHGYVQGSLNLKNNTSQQDYNRLNVLLRRTNAFLPDSIQAQIPLNEPTFRYGKLLSDIPRIESDADTSQWVVQAGLDGRVGGAKWTIDYTHGQSRLATNLANVVNAQKLAYALDAVKSGSNVVCNVTLTNPGLADGCVPIDVFGPTSVSSAAAAYVTDTEHYRATTRLDDVLATVSGALFDTWAGPVNAAISGEWRRLSFTSTSDALPTEFMNCTGLPLNCSATTPLRGYSFGELPNGVHQTVKEGAVEIDIPLLKDSAIARSFNLNGALRYTSYDTSGDYVTWKIGADWKVTDTLRFRGTASRDIRAPTLFDLYSPVTSLSTSKSDLLTGQTTTIQTLSPSNPDLKAEIGNTQTVGVVWRPLPGLSLAVDYYRITISDAITLINGSDTDIQRACYESGGSSPYCALQSRPFPLSNTSPANNATLWYTQGLNISKIRTEGIDFEANYNTQLFGRPTNFRILGAYQPHTIYSTPGLPDRDQGGVAFGPLGLGAQPKWRLVGFFHIDATDNLSFDVEQRWRSSLVNDPNRDNIWLNNHIASFATTNLNVAWNLDSGKTKFTFYLNVQNLFDATPPNAAFPGNGGVAGYRDGFVVGDDVVGRYFTAGVRARF